MFFYFILNVFYFVLFIYQVTIFLLFFYFRLALVNYNKPVTYWTKWKSLPPRLWYSDPQ